MTPEQALDKAVAHAGIRTMEALGEHLGVSKGAVSQWKLPDRRIPAEHCPIIERLTGGEVRCEDLRPDVDWAQLRNTPAVIDAPAIRTEDLKEIDKAERDRDGGVRGTKRENVTT